MHISIWFSFKGTRGWHSRSGGDRGLWFGKVGPNSGYQALQLYTGPQALLSQCCLPSSQCLIPRSALKKYVVTESSQVAESCLYPNLSPDGDFPGSLATENTAPKWACEGPGKSLGFLNTIQAQAWHGYKDCRRKGNILNYLPRRINHGSKPREAQGASASCALTSAMHKGTCDATPG